LATSFGIDCGKKYNRKSAWPSTFGRLFLTFICRPTIADAVDIFIRQYAEEFPTSRILVYASFSTVWLRLAHAWWCSRRQGVMYVRIPKAVTDHRPHDPENDAFAVIADASGRTRVSICGGIRKYFWCSAPGLTDAEKKHYGYWARKPRESSNGQRVNRKTRGSSEPTSGTFQQSQRSSDDGTDESPTMMTDEMQADQFGQYDLDYSQPVAQAASSLTAELTDGERRIVEDNLRQHSMLRYFLLRPDLAGWLNQLALFMVAAQNSFPGSKAVSSVAFVEVRVEFDADGLVLIAVDDDINCVAVQPLFAYELSTVAGQTRSNVYPLSDDGKHFDAIVGDDWRIVVVVDGNVLCLSSCRRSCGHNQSCCVRVCEAFVNV
jgi:hypothetical protein